MIQIFLIICKKEKKIKNNTLFVFQPLKIHFYVKAEKIFIQNFKGKLYIFKICLIRQKPRFP